MMDRHYTAEQRARCDRAESLHRQGQAVYCNDDVVLCETVINGEYASCDRRGRSSESPIALQLLVFS